MVHTVKVKREDIPKELQMLLENGKDSNGEEVFSHMPPFRKWQMRHWKNGKSMHSHICKEMRNHAGA